MASEVAFDRIEGLSELIKAMRGAPERLDKQIRAGFREVAKGVREETRERASLMRPRSAPSRREPKQHWDALVKSITSGADGDTPWVRVGSGGLAWGLTFEYGSRRYREFPWRGSGDDAGYFMWPTIRGNKSEILEAMLDAVEKALGIAPGE